MTYADHEAARAKARDALRRAITAEIVARYEGLHDKDAFDVLDIAEQILDSEELHFDQTKGAVITELIARYPVEVPA